VQHAYGWRVTLAIWQHVPLATIAMATVLVFASHFARVARVHYAYSRKQAVSFRRTLAVSLVHNTVSFLLPMRLGEIALPALSRHQLNIDLRYSTATLILLRLFDAHVLLCLLTFFAGSMWLGRFALAAPLVLLLALPMAMAALQLAATRIPKLAFTQELLAQKTTWFSLYAYTALIWVIKLFALAYLAASLGKLPIDHAWIATIIADGSALSPITGFANAGTFELAFALPLLPLGYTSEALIKTAVNVHLFIFVINIGIGILGFVLLDTKTKSP